MRAFHTDRIILKNTGSVGYKKNKFSAFASINHDQTDGHRDHSDFKITNGYVKLGYDLNAHFSASTDLSIAAFKASDPGPDTLNASPGETIDILRGYWAFTLINEFEKASGAVKVFYNFGEHDITDGFHSNDHNYGVNLYESFNLFKGNMLTTGFDFMNYGGLAENQKLMNGNGIVFADTTLSEIGLYAFTQQKIGKKLTINVGLRFQHHSQFGDIWIPSAGFAYNFNSNTTWKGTVSKGYRSPTMRELFMWGPNPNLNPETIWNYETGLLTNLGKKVQAELTFFIVEGDNLIVNVGPPNGFQNTREVSNKGLELAVNAEPVRNLGIQATYSYINMDQAVYATPEHHLFLNASYQLNKLHLSASIQQISNLDNDPSPVVVNKESYSLVNAKAMYMLSKKFSLFVSGENLLGTSYEVNRYYTMPKTTVFAGLNLNL